LRRSRPKIVRVSRLDISALSLLCALIDMLTSDINHVWQELAHLERRLGVEPSASGLDGWLGAASRVGRVRDALSSSGHTASTMIARQLSGIDLSTIWDLLIAVCKDMALYYGGCTGLGTAIGGIGGAFLGGVGALPGAAAGAAVGAQLGGWVMGVLGLKSLVQDLADAIPHALNFYTKGFREAWGSTAQERARSAFGFDTGTGNVNQAAFLFANGHVLMIMAILTALTAYLTRGRGDRAALLNEIRHSPRLGPRMAAWLEQNEAHLRKNPALQSRRHGALPGANGLPPQNTRSPKLKPAKTAGANSVVRQTGARQMLDPKSLKGWDKVDEIYDGIRANSADVSAIAKNTGMPEARISRIKEHVFFNEHQLDSGSRRFDADIDIANSWSRLREGDFVKSDLDLLQHERFEAKYEAIFKTDYRTAHDAAIRSGRTWTPE
jgi:hypothetical protein